ncbi:MAG: DEAD/DEAH box helicase, partial [Myxococcota bacterium]
MSPSPRSSRGRSGQRSAGRGAPRSGRNRPQPAPLTPIENPPEIDSFEEWDLGDDVQAAIAEMGIVKPTPIQALAIGEVLVGKDVIAKAETGTGKTLAFGAPLMARIDPGRSSVLGLVLSPTRELSEQVYNVLKPLGEARGVKVALVVGGEPLHP